MVRSGLEDSFSTHYCIPAPRHPFPSRRLGGSVGATDRPLGHAGLAQELRGSMLMHGPWKLGLGALGSVALAVAGAAAAAGPAVAASSRSSRPLAATSRPDVVIHGLGKILKSSNWSGYVETAGGYTSVTGTWKVPVNKNTSGTHFSAQWIGIDGDGSSGMCFRPAATPIS